MNRSDYLPHVDVLRAIAVMAVFAYHLDNRLLPAGFVGVDVFFVISGFVVSRSAAARSRKPWRDFVLDFFSRRVRRIVPPLLVCLLVTAFVSALLIPPSWLSNDIPRAGRYAFFGLSNVVLADTTHGYFSPLAEFNPFTHTWSLGVEEQFYLLFPLLFALEMKGERWRMLGGALLVMASAASLTYAASLHVAAHPSGHYLLATRFWELAAGVLLYRVASFAQRHSTMRSTQWMRVRRGVALLAVAALLWSFVYLTPDVLRGYALVVPVVATAVLIAWLPLCMPHRNVAKWPAPVLSLGRMSYSLYLWHWPVIVFFRWTIGLSEPLHVVGAGMVSLALGWLSWRWVERNVTRLFFNESTSPGKIVVTAMALLAAGSVGARTLELKQAYVSLSSVARAPDDWYPSKKQKLRDDQGCSITPRRTGLRAGWQVTYRREGCQGPISGPSVYAIGDSHALAYGPAFAAYAWRTGAQVTVYNNGGCPFLSLQPWREDNEACDRHAAETLAHLLPRLSSQDVVFLPSLRLPRFVDQWTVLTSDVAGKKPVDALVDAARDIALERARVRVGDIRRTGAKVVLPLPTPVLKAPPFRCVDRWTRSNEICAGGMAIDREEFLALRAPVVQALKELAAEDDGVTVFDPAEALCPPAAQCSAFLNGRPLFFDGDHLSAYGNEVLLPHFTAAMKRAVESE